MRLITLLLYSLLLTISLHSNQMIFTGNITNNYVAYGDCRSCISCDGITHPVADIPPQNHSADISSICTTKLDEALVNTYESTGNNYQTVYESYGCYVLYDEYRRLNAHLIPTYKCYYNCTNTCIDGSTPENDCSCPCAENPPENKILYPMIGDSCKPYSELSENEKTYFDENTIAQIPICNTDECYANPYTAQSCQAPKYYIESGTEESNYNPQCILPQYVKTTFSKI